MCGPGAPDVVTGPASSQVLGGTAGAAFPLGGDGCPGIQGVNVSLIGHLNHRRKGMRGLSAQGIAIPGYTRCQESAGGRRKGDSQREQPMQRP